MKIISVRQPWAWLIIHGGKDIENRNWRTKIRGQVLIHAAKGLTRAEFEDGMMSAETAAMTRPFPPGLVLPEYADVERGGIVGSVTIVDCLPASNSPWFFGQFGFVLSDPRPVPFIPMKGQLGFFDAPDDVRAKVLEALGA